MKPDQRFHLEVARLVCRAGELEAEGRDDEGSGIRARVESACLAWERRKSEACTETLRVPAKSGETLEYLGECVWMLCRAEYLRRQGEAEESYDYRLRAESMMDEYRARAG